MTTKPGKSVRSASSDDPETFVGRILNGQYRIDSIIDVGGMGFVYKAIKVGLARQVAIKVLRPSMARDIDIAKRFQREIDVMTQLSHPNIVALIDSGRDASGFNYFVMEYVPGETFAEHLDSNAFSLAEIVEVFRQVCDALIEAHGVGIIHRDLKLENIMVRRLRDGRLHVKMLDFGVARQLGPVESLTRAGELPGTPGIIAPELVEKYEPTAQSDLYSVGVLMFTAISGQPPFTGANDYELVRAHLTQEIPNLRDIVPDVPEPILELTYEMMQKDPSLRPDSAATVRARLESIIRNDPSIDLTTESGIYVPPTAELDRMASEAGNSEVPQVVEQGEIAPTSVVSLLIAMVMVLALIIIYLAYHILIIAPGG